MSVTHTHMESIVNRFEGLSVANHGEQCDVDFSAMSPDEIKVFFGSPEGVAHRCIHNGHLRDVLMDTFGFSNEESYASELLYRDANPEREAKRVHELKAAIDDMDLHARQTLFSLLGNVRLVAKHYMYHQFMHVIASCAYASVRMSAIMNVYVYEQCLEATRHSNMIQAEGHAMPGYYLYLLYNATSATHI